VSVWAGQ
jgi:hypothetical protein